MARVRVKIRVKFRVLTLSLVSLGTIEFDELTVNQKHDESYGYRTDIKDFHTPFRIIFRSPIFPVLF